MAIYSLNHKHLGKTSQRRPHTAAAHIRYISRTKACAGVLAERMPEQAGAAEKWMVQEEDNDRKNARVCDKIMLALPKELTPAQQQQLVKEFAEKATKGRASWYAAFHTKDKDQNNPHCHLVIRDRDPKTRKRVCEMSERGSTERLRELWEQHANNALERAGQKERIDRRTLKEQGVERQATIHEGVRAKKMRERGARPESKVVQFPNAATAQTRKREVDYREIDSGKTRAEHNSNIYQLSKEEPMFQTTEMIDASIREKEQELDALKVNRDKELKRHNELVGNNKTYTGKGFDICMESREKVEAAENAYLESKYELGPKIEKLQAKRQKIVEAEANKIREKKRKKQREKGKGTEGGY
jgi:hypothetical protein